MDKGKGRGMGEGEAIKRGDRGEEAIKEEEIKREMKEGERKEWGSKVREEDRREGRGEKMRRRKEE